MYYLALVLDTETQIGKREVINNKEWNRIELLETTFLSPKKQEESYRPRKSFKPQCKCAKMPQSPISVPPFYISDPGNNQQK